MPPDETPEVTRRLTAEDRAQVQANIDHLEKLGEMVGGWGSTSTQCYRKSFTTTITFDKEVDVLDVPEFVRMMEKAPQLLGPTLRRLLEVDAELERTTSVTPTIAQEEPNG